MTDNAASEADTQVHVRKVVDDLPPNAYEFFDRNELKERLRSANNDVHDEAVNLARRISRQ